MMLNLRGPTVKALVDNSRALRELMKVIDGQLGSDNKLTLDAEMVSAIQEARTTLGVKMKR